MNAFDSTCYNELAKDPTNIQYVNGDPVVNPSISGCPNQCSLNGNCVSGTCHCHHGYTSIDCSVKEGVPPQIHRIRGSVTLKIMITITKRMTKILIFVFMIFVLLLSLQRWSM